MSQKGNYTNSFIVDIHPTAIIENTKINGNVYIGAYSIIGFPPEKIGVYPDSPFGVEINDGTVITGGVTIDAGVRRKTVIGRNCFIMKQSHFGHCVLVGDDVIVAPGALIGGGVEIGQGANIGLGAAIHPNVKIPPFTMIGMNAVITKGLQMVPFGVYAGNPAKFIKMNDIGIQKAGLSKEDVERIIKEWNDNL